MHLFIYFNWVYRTPDAVSADLSVLQDLGPNPAIIPLKHQKCNV